MDGGDRRRIENGDARLMQLAAHGIRRLAGELGNLLVTQFLVGHQQQPFGGGLVAAWAEENNRTALFDALRRKEVYGTSGTRIECS